MPVLIPAVIGDMDGTLCDVTSVRHHVLTKPKNFDKFHAESINCPPHQVAIDWCVKYASSGKTILILTGRMRKWETVTTTWLDRHLPCPYVGPFMREDGDLRPDYVVKREMYDELSQMYDIKAAIDDNPAIVKLWEELSIPVTVVPGWDHDHPQKLTAR